MRSLVRKYKKDPKIRETAEHIIQHIPNKQYYSEAEAIFQWVRSNIRYTRDTTGVEHITTPDVLLDTRSQDCESQATLLASLLESVGHPTRFVAVGFAPSDFSHVFTQTRIGDKWITGDTTEPNPFGWTPRLPFHMTIYN